MDSISVGDNVGVLEGGGNPAVGLDVTGLRLGDTVGSDVVGLDVTGLRLGDTVGSNVVGLEVTGLRLRALGS